MGVVHLIRHGVPAVTGVLLGRLDSPLASDELAPSHLCVGSVFSSPLRRARRTAELLFPEHSITILEDLAEIGMGEWEGRRWAEIETSWPDMARRKCEDWTAVTPPGGESWSDFAMRVNRAWTVIRVAPPAVAVVAHAGVNAVLAHLLAGVDALKFSQSYGEVVSLDTI